MQQANVRGNAIGSADALQQMGQAGGMDQADIVWTKMQTLKDKYLQDMKDLYAMLTTRSQQHMPQEQLQKLSQYKNVLERMMPYLIAAKENHPKEFKQDQVEAFEKQIVSIMETFKRRKQVVPQPQQAQQQASLGQVQQSQKGPQNLQPDKERQIITEPPMKRLVRAINNMSSQVLASAIGDIELLINLSDKLGGSAPGAQSRAAVGEDLAQVTKCRMQARVLSSPEAGAIIKKVKRRVDSMALSLVSSDGSVLNSLQRLGPTDLETESTATSRMKRSKLEVNLHEEINRINEGLIETRVEIGPQGIEENAAEGKHGIVVTCSYTAIAMEPNTTLRSNSFHIALPPLRLLIPPQYPHCSPIVLEDDFVSNSNDLISSQAWDAFKRTVRCLSQPVLLGDMVKAWDASAYDVLLESAISQGGGCFSSSYGSWGYRVNA